MLRNLNRTGKTRRARQKALISKLEKSVLELEAVVLTQPLFQLDQHFIKIQDQIREIKKAEGSNPDFLENILTNGGNNIKFTQCRIEEGQNLKLTRLQIDRDKNYSRLHHNDIRIRGNDLEINEKQKKLSKDTKQLKPIRRLEDGKSKDLSKIAFHSQAPNEIGRALYNKIDNRVSTLTILALSLQKEGTYPKDYHTSILNPKKLNEAFMPFTKNEMHFMNDLLEAQKKIILKKVQES